MGVQRKLIQCGEENVQSYVTTLISMTIPNYKNTKFLIISAQLHMYSLSLIAIRKMCRH